MGPDWPRWWESRKNSDNNSEKHKPADATTARPWWDTSLKVAAPERKPGERMRDVHGTMMHPISDSEIPPGIEAKFREWLPVLAEYLIVNGGSAKGMDGAAYIGCFRVDQAIPQYVKLYRTEDNKEFGYLADDLAPTQVPNIYN